MGNALEGKTYQKASHQSFQPRISTNLSAYKTQQRVSSSSNIHSHLSFTKFKSSNTVSQQPQPLRKTQAAKKPIEDIQRINEE